MTENDRTDTPTPGPWFIHDWTENSGPARANRISISSSPSGSMLDPLDNVAALICRIEYSPALRRIRGIDRANAHLIAAAPDLLACCNTARRRLEEVGHDVSWLDDVIAKAKGRT